MSDQTSRPEWVTLFHQIRVYERVTGLTALKIEPDETCVRVEWAYPDESWAGTNTYDMPFEQVIQKLAAQVFYEEKRVELGLPRRDTGELPHLELIASD